MQFCMCVTSRGLSHTKPEGIHVRHVQKPVDMVLCMLGTISHLCTIPDAVQCFQSVHAALRPEGLMVIEALHPTHLFDGDLALGDVWDVDDGNSKLVVTYGYEDDRVDPITQVVHRTVCIDRVPDGMGTDAEDVPEVLWEGVVEQRVFTVGELDLLAALTGFAPLAWLWRV
eukprot:jgi/Botrbrau1/11900/Bobra.0171s0011.1